MDNLAAMEELADVADPDLRFALTVHDDFVPRLRFVLDPFLVPIQRVQMKSAVSTSQLFGKLGDGVRPDMIDRGRGDTVPAEKIQKRDDSYAQVARLLLSAGAKVANSSTRAMDPAVDGVLRQHASIG
jgi:hypothetical protein